MRHVVIGTAGHIDHGKTALVRALTGVDTDRLPEEKRRGITIELGFAAWPLAPDVHASIVDVPGHERLVHTMVAGATGVDLALLCIAADDGVMPQTREHLDVLSLLGVPRGMVVLTKCDLADAEVLELVEADVREAVRGTVLDGAPVIRTSSRTGAGLEALATAVRAATRDLPARDAAGPAFLPLDRVFQKHGFGTVVTGTLARGALAIGDTVGAFGEREQPLAALKVRGLQSSNEARERVTAGMRVAVNIAGREVDALARGMVLSNAAAPPVAAACVVSVRVLGHAAPLCDEELTVHLGTSEQLAAVLPVGASELGPGSSGTVLVRFGRPVAAYAGQRVIFRRPGLARGATVAGGEVLDPRPPAFKGAPRLLAGVAAELHKGVRERLVALALAARAEGLGADDLTWRVPSAGAREAADALVREDALARVADRLVHTSFLDEVIITMLAVVKEHARSNPLAPPLAEAEITTRLPAPARSLVPAALARAVARGLVAVADGSVAMPGASARSAESVAPEAGALVRIYQDARFTPPSDGEAAAQVKLPPKRLQEVLAALRREGRVVKVATGLHFDPAALEEVTVRVLGALAGGAELSAGDFKDLLGGVSRKWAIPLLEYLDHKRVTVRVGNYRRLHSSRRP